MLFRNLFFAVVMFSSINLIAHEGNDYSKVKLQINSASDFEKLFNSGIDIHCQLDRKNIASPEIWVSEAEIEQLRQLGLTFTVLVESWKDYYKSQPLYSTHELHLLKEKYGIMGFGFGSMGGFYTFNEVVAHLDTMRMLYPNLITAKTSIGNSIESRSIWMVKISDNPDVNENEPQVMYTAMTHAREPQGMMTLMYYMYYLLERYGIDPEVTYLVNNREMYFLPVLNPDGYEYNRSTNPSGGGMWRKNRRNNGGSFGVDLNRNYGPYEYWNAPNGGSSTSPSSDTYRGTAPFSEPEDAGMKDFLLTKKIRAALNYHTYSNLLIYPYGALVRETADSLIYREYARDMTAYNGYVYGTDQQTVGYATRGNSDDYMYDGEPIATRGKIFAMTPEVGSSSDGFWPSQSRIFPLAIENLKPNLYYSWIAGEYPSISQKTFIKNGNYIVPGDSVQMIIELKNKGLSSAYNVGVTFTSLSPYVNILSGASISIDSLPGRESVSTNISPMKFYISPITPNGSKHKVAAVIAINGTALISDTTSIVVGTPSVLFTDNFEGGTSNWTLTNTWGLTTSSSKSPVNSITDSPAGNYPANVNTDLVKTQSIDLSNSILANLEFWTRWDIEASWDFGQVQVSTNNGSSWASLAGSYTRPGSGKGKQPSGSIGYDGTQITWVKESMDLSSYVGMSNVKLRFNLQSDGSVQKDGWYIDDVSIISYQTTSSGSTSSFSTVDGWNIISVPLEVPDCRKSIIFPSSTSNAYWFNDFYLVKDSLQNGYGYWLKFNGNQNHTINGIQQSAVNMPLKTGWNLIGGLNGSLPVASLITTPPGIIQGQIFGYNNGYHAVSLIEKGNGYWLKSSQNGSLTMNLSLAKSQIDNPKIEFDECLLISDASGQMVKVYLDENYETVRTELPPIPPSSVLDSRFLGNYNISGLTHESILQINNAVYPVKISIEKGIVTLKVNDLITGKLINEILTTENSLTITNSGINNIKFSKSEGVLNFFLSQNYPNPFNPVTTIKYQIPKNSHVTLKIFDVLGREVKTIVSEQKSIGRYEVEFDASSISSGLYFYRIKAGDFSDTKKMIVIK